MTFIVIPHGGRDLNTRSFEISYRRLRTAGTVLALLALVWIGMATSWVYVSSYAARVPGLQHEIATLKAERDQVQALAVSLRRLESQYSQVRDMLGANRPAEPGSVWLPAMGTSGHSDVGRVGDAEAGVPNAWPLAQRGFVTREHLGRIPGQHPGIDIAVAEGTYILAAGAGVVSEAGEDSVYGKFVRISHPAGYETVYGHASDLYVISNEHVEKNQVIALSGNTGRSTAPHLHFEVWKDGESIDPRQIVTSP